MSYPPPPGYGQQPGYGGGFPPPSPGFGGPVQQTNGLAIAALVLGILAILSCGATSIFAIPLGIAGLIRSKKLSGSGKGMAIGGLITGVIGAVIGVLMLVFVVWAANEVDDYDFYCGSDGQTSSGVPCESQGSQTPAGGEDIINGDPSDNICNTDRYIYDPDC